MLILVDPVTGKPLVVEVSSPRTTVRVVEISEHVVHVALDDGFNAAVHLVLAREVGARLVAALAPALGRQAAWLIEQDCGRRSSHLRLVTPPG
ncbi:hypothetical protein [Kutzneria sp. NPDC052558]|uniref:hypothetical protein n=1 Tax=Kutzneria sp. NPDC052558 TaxID=3364121 RepID=UPI0037CBCD44